MAPKAPFQIVEILGEGSFGTVCVAQVVDDPQKRLVALKILKQNYASNEKVLNRTRDEANLLVRIQHPNVVRVEQLVILSGRPVVVMELVEGVSLDHLLLQFREGLPVSVALDIVRLTASALNYAYSMPSEDEGRPMRVIHRDIKPSNLLLSVKGELKVVDFGIAKSEFDGREAHTQSVVMGSRPYMAPERLDGIDDSPAVDVYSLGMTLYELLMGRPMSLSINPVAHDQAMDRQLASLDKLSLDGRTLSELKAIIRTMCAYDRDNRPASSDVVSNLERMVHTMPREEQITLPTFAQEVVLPIYEARPRVDAETVAERFPEDDLLAEITGAMAEPEAAATAWRHRVMSVGTMILAGILLVLVLMLLAAVLARVWLQRTTQVEPQLPDGAVTVGFVVEDALTAALGEQAIATGSYGMQPGAVEVMVSFGEAQSARCMVEARDAILVRLALSEGVPMVSVDDADPQPCALTPLTTEP